MGGPSLRVDVMGRDLTLLDALEGHWTPPQADAPGPWRDFASGPGPCRFSARASRFDVRRLRGRCAARWLSGGALKIL